MAGMRLAVLFDSSAASYCGCSLSASDCLSSQIAIELPVAVPLWKVKVGPRADKLTTGPARVRFFLASFLRRSDCQHVTARPTLLQKPAMEETTYDQHATHHRGRDHDGRHASER